MKRSFFKKFILGDMMKITIKELAENATQRTQFVEYLAARVHTSDKLLEADIAPFQKSMPKAERAHEIFMSYREAEYDLMILKVIATTKEEELEEELNSLYETIERWKKMDLEYESKRGFTQGYEMAKTFWRSIVGVMNELLNPLEGEALQLKEADKKSGAKLLSDEEYKEIQASGNWNLTHEQMEELKELVIDGRTIEELETFVAGGKEAYRVIKAMKKKHEELK